MSRDVRHCPSRPADGNPHLDEDGVRPAREQRVDHHGLFRPAVKIADDEHEAPAIRLVQEHGQIMRRGIDVDRRYPHAPGRERAADAPWHIARCDGGGRFESQHRGVRADFDGSMRSNRQPRRDGAGIASRGNSSYTSCPPGGHGVHTRRGLPKTALAEAAPRNRGCHSVDDLVDHPLVSTSASDAERVAARDESLDSPLGDPDPTAQALHLEAVGDGKALESKLVAKEAGHDPWAERRGSIVDRGHHDVRAHDRLDPVLDRGCERPQSPQMWILGDGRKVEVRVDCCVAVPWEMLGAGRDAGVLHSFYIGSCMAGDGRRVGSEGAHPDHRVLRIAVDVGYGSQVEIDPAGRQLGADRGRHVACERDVVGDPESKVARVRASGPGLQPRHIASFFVDADKQSRARAMQLGREAGQLRFALEIAGEEDHAAQSIGGAAKHPIRGPHAFKTRQDASQRDSLDGRHPFTAPAVRPPAR